MKVDVIEAGFPASSNGDFEAVQRGRQGDQGHDTIAGLCRANDKDIQRGIDALKGAKSWRIHTFLATSPLHMKMKLRMTPDQVFEQAQLAVRYAKQGLPGRGILARGWRAAPNSDFLCRVLEAVIREGATTINIPDTVGLRGAGAIRRNDPLSCARRIPNSDKAVWSRALPQRPRHGGGEFARRGAASAARARSNAR